LTHGVQLVPRFSRVGGDRPPGFHRVVVPTTDTVFKILCFY